VDEFAVVPARPGAPAKVAAAIGNYEALAIRLDVTSPQDAQAAVAAAVAKCGRIVVLVNNAGNFAWLKTA
jgi:NAD(P)-dependent dehydrogenase (short-subunit alcohol dehydrogenase family)